MAFSMAGRNNLSNARSRRELSTKGGYWNNSTFQKAQRGLTRDVGGLMSKRRAMLSSQGLSQGDVDRLTTGSRIGAQQAFGDLYADQAESARAYHEERNEKKKGLGLGILGSALQIGSNLISLGRDRKSPSGGRRPLSYQNRNDRNRLI